MSSAAQELKKAKKPLPKWVRILWIVFKYVVVPLLCPISLWIGMVIGYVYIGHQPVSDIWNINTWRHVFDLIFP